MLMNFCNVGNVENSCDQSLESLLMYNVASTSLHAIRCYYWVVGVSHSQQYTVFTLTCHTQFWPNSQED